MPVMPAAITGAGLVPVALPSGQHAPTSPSPAAAMVAGQPPRLVRERDLFIYPERSVALRDGEKRTR